VLSVSEKKRSNQHIRQRTNGQTLYYHAAITPVIVCPGQSQVVALPPEYIMPQAGHATQDCARAAGKRWLSKHAAPVAPRGATLLGGALTAISPFVQWCYSIVAIASLRANRIFKATYLSPPWRRDMLSFLFALRA
jgi:hypothetical protein